MEEPHNCIALELGEFLDWNIACLLGRSVAVSLIGGKNGVGPEIGFDGVGPSRIFMYEACAGGL